MSEENKAVQAPAPADPPKEIKKIPDMSSKDMKEFILGVCDGKIFTDRHTRSDHEIGLVFMVFALSGPDQLGIDINDVGCVWEWLSEAGPRSINGMPCFFSCRFMNKKDAKFAFIQIE